MKEKLKENMLYIIIGLVILIGLLYYVIDNHEEEEPILFDHPLETTTEEESFLFVDIKGEVSNPGVYKLKSNTRLYELIYKAGGLTSEADINAINQSMIMLDEMTIYIPSYEEHFTPLGRPSDTDGTVKENVININTATKEELMTLSGIGESTANAIIEYRTKNGDFDSIENIKDVAGIGDSTFEHIESDITV